MVCSVSKLVGPTCENVIEAAVLDCGRPRAAAGGGLRAPHNLPLPTLEASTARPAAYALEAPTSFPSVSPHGLCTCRLWPRKPLRDSEFSRASHPWPHPGALPRSLTTVQPNEDISQGTFLSSSLFCPSLWPTFLVRCPWNCQGQGRCWSRSLAPQLRATRATFLLCLRNTPA